jgi:hypothetical protein
MTSIFLALFNTDTTGKPIEVAAPGYTRQPVTLIPSRQHEGVYTNRDGVDFAIPREGWGIITSAGIMSASGEALVIAELTTPRDTKLAAVPDNYKLGDASFLSFRPGGLVVPAERVSEMFSTTVALATMTGSTLPNADLIEKLCQNLAVQTVSNAIALQSMVGGTDPDLQKAVDEAPTLIKAAGHDMDALFPVDDRPTAIFPDDADAPPSPATPILELQPTTLITTANDEQMAAVFYWMDEDNSAADMHMLAAAHGFRLQYLEISDDPNASEELSTRYDNGENVLADWNPTPPTPDHKLAYKCDSENGPFAWFIAPLSRTDRDAIRQGFVKALKVEG